MKVNIIFRSPDDVISFVNTVSKFDDNIDIEYGSILLDGKSVEGLYNLPLNTKLTCVIHSANCDNIVESITKFKI